MGFQIEDGVLKKYTEEPGVTQVVVPEGVTTISGTAFMECKMITDISLPSSLEQIEDGKWEWQRRLGAFAGCSKLQNIALPEGVTSIGFLAFAECSSLEKITLPEGVTTIGAFAFDSCESLTDIALPESLTSIGDRAFFGCKSLTDIALPERLTSIGEYAFYGCESLTDIALPERLTSIGDSAFSGCICLTNIALPENLTSIQRKAFCGCTSLISITLPKHIKSVPIDVFYGCLNLKEIVICNEACVLSWDRFCSKYETMSRDLAQTLFSVHSRMDDAVIKNTMLRAEVWEWLEPEQQAALFQRYYKKALADKFKRCITAVNTEAMEAAMIQQLSDQSTARECTIAAAFLEMVYDTYGTALQGLYATLKSIKKAGTAVAALEKNAQLMQQLTGAGEFPAISGGRYAAQALCHET